MILFLNISQFLLNGYFTISEYFITHAYTKSLTSHVFHSLKEKIDQNVSKCGAG